MIRKITLGIVILLVLIIVYNLLLQITDAVKSGERLSIAADTVFKLESRNRELKKKLAQIQSPEYIEEQARNKLGLGKTGETVVIIPEEKLKMVLGSSQAAIQNRVQNWLGWFRVFFNP